MARPNDICTVQAILEFFFNIDTDTPQQVGEVVGGNDVPPERQNSVVARSQSRPRRTELHDFALKGDLPAIMQLFAGRAGSVAALKMVHATDSRGWQPVHEAARSGNTQVLE
jgi:hypothetical protein